jgi:hypothetical protein
MSVVAMMLAAAAASSVTNYDCTVNQPQSLVRDGDKVSLRTIKFPQLTEADWKFGVRVVRANDITATVTWDRDPIQIAGEHPAIETSDGSLAFVAAGEGCMFTETGCLTTVQIVDDKDGAKVVVMPTALRSDHEAHTREPFTVIIEGRCARSGAAK